MTPIGMALLPGFPRPLAAGPHYEAMRTATLLNGPTIPVLIDQDGVAWAGLTALNVYCELGIDPPTLVITDGWAAAASECATRDMGVLEWADLTVAIAGRVADTATFGRTNELVSSWIRCRLGKKRGFSPRQVHDYLRVGRATREERSLIAGCPTLGAALRKLDGTSGVRAKMSRSEMSIQDCIAMLSEQLGAQGSPDDETADLLRTLHALLEIILGINE